jgi:hypothetical protein
MYIKYTGAQMMMLLPRPRASHPRATCIARPSGASHPSPAPEPPPDAGASAPPQAHGQTSQFCPGFLVMYQPGFGAQAVRHAWVRYAGADLDVSLTLNARVGRLAWGVDGWMDFTVHGTGQGACDYELRTREIQHL